MHRLYDSGDLLIIIDLGFVDEADIWSYCIGGVDVDLAARCKCNRLRILEFDQLEGASFFLFVQCLSFTFSLFARAQFPET